MCSSNLINISVEILEQQLRNRSALCLLLDCRPFLAHNESHILNAINIHCPPILRRRKGGRLPLRTIIPDVIIRDQLTSGQFRSIILYDESSNQSNILKQSELLLDSFIDESLVNFVAKCLNQEAGIKNIYVLDGGFEKFRKNYPQLCTSKEFFRNCTLNKSPILGNLTWPLKLNNSNGLSMPNSLKICCNSAATSQQFLSGNLKYQNFINNNSANNQFTQLTNCNNNIILNNKNFVNISEDNNKNLISNSKSKIVDINSNSGNQDDSKSKMVGSNVLNGYQQPHNNCSNNLNYLVSHHSNQINNSQNHNQSPNQKNKKHNHFNNSNNNHNNVNFEQCSTNQQNFANQLINNGLGGSCSQLNQINVCCSDINLTKNIAINHSLSLSNLSDINENNQNNLSYNENCNQINFIKFNSFGNDVNEPVEILPHLLLGSELHASKLNMLKRIGVTALLNVSHSCPNHFEQDFLYKCIPVQDSSYEDISIYFTDAIQFIDQIKRENGRVLVHCHAGISRSATICMAYIMENKKLRMEAAYEFVKNRRKIVSPNFNFMGQLLSFESVVFADQENKKEILETIDESSLKMDTSEQKINLTDNSEKKNSTSNELKLNSQENNCCFFGSTDNQLNNIFDFSNCNNRSDFSTTTISKLGFSPIKKLNSASITPLLSPT